MKVAARMTVATAVVVAIAAAAYAMFDVRARAAERHAAIEREARSVAQTLRGRLELQASAFRAPTDAQLDALSATTSGWRVTVLPRSWAAPGELAGPVSDAQRRRLAVMLDTPVARDGVEGDHYFYDLPLRASGPVPEEPTTLGM